MLLKDLIGHNQVRLSGKRILARTLIAFTFSLTLLCFTATFGLEIFAAQVTRLQATTPQAAVASTTTNVTTGPDTLVICASEFQNALKPWVDYRKRQGHKIVIRFPKKTSFEIRKMIQEIARGGNLKNVLLVGDSFDANARPQQLVPTDFVKAKVNVKFGSEPDIATDNTYADLDGDGVPDLTIGRLPVDSSEELGHLINRIIEYESGSADEGWRRNINLIAGVGGFGSLVDKIIEHTTKQIVTDLIPADYQTSMTYGSWTSPYCPDPRKFSETAIARFNEGCMFWVYIGHGNRTQLDKIFLPDQSYSILDKTNVHELNCTNGSPVAICLACYTGATDDAEDGLAETMLRQPRGPISVVCGSRVTMPYAMSLFSLEMLNEFFHGDAKTMGELMMRSKQRLVQTDRPHDEYREMIEGLGKSFSPTPELLLEERLEHVHLMHLLGDPLLRLKRPVKMVLTAEPLDLGDPGATVRPVAAAQVANSKMASPATVSDVQELPAGISGAIVNGLVDYPERSVEAERIDATPVEIGARPIPRLVKAGEQLRIRGVAANAGQLQIEVTYQRDRFRHRPTFRSDYDSSHESFASYQVDYVKAHDLVCSRQTIDVAKGEFTADVKIPADASGRCDIRTMLIGLRSIALGAVPIDVKPMSSGTRTARLK